MNVFKLENQFCAKQEVQLEPWAETFYSLALVFSAHAAARVERLSLARRWASARKAAS